MDLSDILRPEVKDFEPYVPGKPIEEVKRELGLKKVIKLASNENALGVSRKVVAALKKQSAEVFRYPEGPGTLLRRALARHWNVRESQLILGAGSDEIIELLGKTFFRPGDEIIVSEHAFTRYKMAGDLMGIKTVIVPMKGYSHDLPAMSRAINARTKAVFIVNPNNPTGTYSNEKEVREFFSGLSVINSNLPMPFIVFDEAYYEFAKGLAGDYPESLDYFRKGFNVVVLRTFSKAYGLAGLRIGYGIANASVVDAMDRVRPPFNVSSPAQAAALAALTDQEHVKKSVALVKKEIRILAGELERLNFSPVPSAGNFLLVDCAPWRGKDLFGKLLKKGLITRALEEYGYPRHIRVTVGRPEENRFFIRKLKEVLKGQ